MVKTCLPKLFLPIHIDTFHACIYTHTHTSFAIIQFVFSSWIKIVVIFVAVNFPDVTATFCFFVFCTRFLMEINMYAKSFWQYMHSGHTSIVYEFKIHRDKILVGCWRWRPYTNHRIIHSLLHILNKKYTDNAENPL